MALDDIVQVYQNGRADAISLSEFMWKPASFMVTRRLAPSIHTLNFYIDLFEQVAIEGAAKITQAVMSSGFVIVDSFELGFTITQRNQALRHAATGKSYRWAGTLPKVVAASSQPLTSGGFGANAWLEVSDATLRQDIISNGLVTSDIVRVQSVLAGAMQRTLQQKLHENISIKDFYKESDADYTAAFNKAIAVINTLANTVVTIPAGRYVVGELIPIESRTFGFVGAGSSSTIIECNRVGGAALSADAWTNAAIVGSPAKPFMNACNMSGFRIIAPTATTLLYLRGLARSQFKDIRLNGTDRSAGTIGLDVASTQLCYFDNIYCAYPDGSLPETGIRISNAPRYITSGGVAVSGGLPSNNTFINIYPEGCDYGILLANGDQNMFLGGCPEGSLKRSLTVGIGCKYNTFISMAFESKDATGGEILDSGDYTKYINCYASNVNSVELRGRGSVIDGGYYQKITLTSVSKACTVENITIGHWHALVGDNGGVIIQAGAKGARFKNIYSSPLAKYIYPNVARTAIVLTSSPFEWENLEGVPVKLLIFGGTASQLLIYRGGDFWGEELPEGTKRGVYHLLAGDKIRLTYSVAPTINLIPLNGM